MTAVLILLGMAFLVGLIIFLIWDLRNEKKTLKKWMDENEPPNPYYNAELKDEYTEGMMDIDEITTKHLDEYDDPVSEWEDMYKPKKKQR